MATREINGKAVREIRGLLGLDQAELARRCDITQGSLSNVERGTRKASPQLMRALADQLGVHLDAITSPVPETAANPVNRSASARVAAYESWAQTPDRAARTAAARTGLLAKFEREARDKLGPAATEAQIAAGAEAAKHAHYVRMRAARRPS